MSTPGRDLNLGPSVYEVGGELRTRPRHLVVDGHVMLGSGDVYGGTDKNHNSLSPRLRCLVFLVRIVKNQYVTVVLA